MKSILATIAALALAAVSAQQNIVSITGPLRGAVLTAGESTTITWINPTVQTISKIALAKGDPAALQVVATIAENVDASTGSYTWNIPSDTPSGNDYALELGTSPNMSFAGLFTIEGATGNTTATGSSSATGNTTTAASSTSSLTASSTNAANATTTPVTTTVSSTTTQTTSTAVSSSASSTSSSAPVASSSSTSTRPSQTPTNAGAKMSVPIAAVACAGAAALALM
ncbi:hypothetical protein EC973_009268 [Apophysomyces ossiformis]|uniref:Yeast cell wall synthesis Kre9/Knh1-like N-terminal domain-containing protein n=1 Tax=Apophysomyces ossiformis TaxID=679940 RepID=A0A8H7BS89_9FUNG|nr:hypothetical protein EC973_009268 [Apophysomyces ossiformis]